MYGLEEKVRGQMAKFQKDAEWQRRRRLLSEVLFTASL